MSSQWEYLLKNLGEWRGSFTTFSPEGKLIDDIPSILSLESKNHNSIIILTLERFPPDQVSSKRFLEFTEAEVIGFTPSNWFLESGGYCKGSLQFSPYGTFGTEFSFLVGDRRLRSVELYNNAQFSSLTLIREKSPTSTTPERPHLTVEQLIGKWTGIATTFYRDWSPNKTYSTQLEIKKIGSNKLEQQLTFGNQDDNYTINSTAIIEDSRLIFEENSPPKQILLLPDGASCNCPLKIELGSPFFLEMGWLISPKNRQRIMRNYNDKGGWESITFVEEEKIS